MTIQQYEERAEVALSSPQDVAVHRLGEWAHSADAAYQVAERLSASAFVPAQFKGKPVELTAAILSGLEIGLSPMAAMRSFDIIQGQAAPRAITLRAVVQAHGHEMVLVESTNTRCRMKGRRRGSEEWQTVTWDMTRAQALGLTGKDNWKKQPGAMLLARATSELARLIASDAILGIGYSAEEVADGGGEQTDTTTPAPSGGTRKMSRPRPADQTSGAEEAPDQATAVEPDEPSAPEPDPITSAQLQKIGILCGELGLTDAAEARREVGAVIGREISSRKELSKAEAHRVIDHFTSLVEQPFEPVDAEVVEDGQ